jgi:hypothetical protein
MRRTPDGEKDKDGQFPVFERGLRLQGIDRRRNEPDAAVETNNKDK